MATLRVPDVLPTPAQDSETLRKAFQDKKLWGTAEKEVKVISVLGHRNANQRRKIRETYHELYNESLIDRLRYELKNVSLFDTFVRSEHDFWNAILLWTMDPPERDAELANKALKKKEQKGVDHLQVIIEIACASSPHHLMAVRQAYCSSFDCSLEEHITSNVALPLRKLLLGLVSSYRYDGELVDANIADSEASVLHDAIKKKQFDCNDVVWILSIRNTFQLKETFECYKQKYGKPIEQDIKSSGTSDLESILIMVICCIETPEKHFAEVVRKSVHRIGTDEDSLSRAIVTRAEIDMMKIRGEYSNMYETSLDKEVIGDTSGDYQKFLVTLLGGKL